MFIDSTVEIATYRKLADGDIFVAAKNGGSTSIFMKVALRADQSDQPNSMVLQLSNDRAPELYSAPVLGSNSLVAKFKNLIFALHPQKEDIIFDRLRDKRTHEAGCLFLIDNEVYLSANMVNNTYDQRIYYVNIKTGEGWYNIDLQKAIAVPCWQIIETAGDKKPWVKYEISNESATKAA